MKAKDFRLGFASLNNHTIEFYEDLVSLLDDKIVIYFSVFSKIEYVINQLFVNYHSSMFIDVDYIVYKDISNQPMLPLYSRKNEFYVLSVGFSQNGTPLVTISENDKPICYRLPEDYGEWAMNVVGMANMGERLFPCKVVFSLIDGRYLVDIL